MNKPSNRKTTLVWYVPEHFTEQELVDPDTYEYYHDRGWDVWRLFHPTILWTADKVRENVGVPCFINNWSSSGVNRGDRKWSGYRTPSSPYYSQYSAHNGKAVDMIVYGWDIENYVDFRHKIIDNPWNDAFKYITRLEMTYSGNPIGWIHMDVAAHDKEKLGIKQIHV